MVREEPAVLGELDGLHGRAQHFHGVFVENSAFVEFQAAVEGGLSSEGEQNAVGALLFDDLCDEFGREREEIGRIRHSLARLVRGDVGIDEDRADAFLAQGLERL